MFDKLEDLLVRFEEVLNELGEPGVTDNQERFQKLMKEQSELQPIVDTYKEYKENKETIQDSLSMLEEEKDEEMREMLKEELSDAKKRVEELEKELKILLLPKDPNDSKNVIVEIRAGAGGDEAAPVRESVSAGRAAWQKMLGNDSCRPSGERLKRSGRLKKIECCKTERKGRGGDVTGG